MPDDLPVWPSLDVVAYHVEKQLDLQWQLWDLMDGRLRTILGFAGAAFAAEIAFFSSGSDLNAVSTGFVIAASISVAVATALAGLAFMPRTFQRPPRPRYLRENFLVMSDADTKLQVMDTMIAAYEENSVKVHEKASAFRNSVLALSLAVGLSSLAALIELLY